MKLNLGRGKTKRKRSFPQLIFGFLGAIEVEKKLNSEQLQYLRHREFSYIISFLDICLYSIGYSVNQDLTLDELKEIALQWNYHDPFYYYELEKKVLLLLR